MTCRILPINADTRFICLPQWIPRAWGQPCNSVPHPPASAKRPVHTRLERIPISPIAKLFHIFPFLSQRAGSSSALWHPPLSSKAAGRTINLPSSICCFLISPQSDPAVPQQRGLTPFMRLTAQLKDKREERKDDVSACRFIFLQLSPLCCCVSCGNVCFCFQKINLIF